MRFSRENFEEYVLDYLDGSMPSEQQLLFIEFLKNHPDLEKEIRAVRDMQLTAESVDFPAKSNLFKLQTSDKEKILDNSFEEAAVAYYEGDLNPKQKNNLEVLIQNNEVFKQPFEQFSRTFLEPDESIVFKRKSSLKKHTLQQRSIRIFTVISSAAAVLILLILFINPAKESVQTNMAEENNIHRETIRLPFVKSISPGIISTGNSAPSSNVMARMKEFQVVPDRKQDLSLPLMASRSEIIPNIPESDHLMLNPVYDQEPGTNDFLSIGEFARDHLLARVFNREVRSDQETASFWNLAMNGLERFNSMTDGDISIERQSAENGKNERITFETAVFGLSVPSRNNSSHQ